jgi:membrane-associated phospholipid phosphatase
VTSDQAPTPLPVLRRRVLVAGLVLLALSIVVTALVAFSGPDSVVQRTDERWYRWMVHARWVPLTAVSDVLDVTFGTLVVWPVRGLVAIILAVRRHWLALTSWVVAVGASEACIGPVKALVDRPRPPGSLIATSGASYPSGHAIASTVTLIGVAMAFTSGRQRLRLMLAAVVVAATVDLSRTYLLAHWLSDVIGGSLIAAGLALTVPEAFEVVRDRIRARSRTGPAT